jgi:hypothetical protein
VEVGAARDQRERDRAGLVPERHGELRHRAATRARRADPARPLRRARGSEGRVVFLPRARPTTSPATRSSWTAASRRERRSCAEADSARERRASAARSSAGRRVEGSVGRRARRRARAARAARRSGRDPPRHADARAGVPRARGRRRRRRAGAAADRLPRRRGRA